LLPCAQTLYLIPSRSSSPPSSRSSPSRVAMGSSLPTPRFWSYCDIMRVRRLLGWQSTEYDGRIQCGTTPLADLQRSEIVLFSSYTLAGLMLPASSFFLTLLDNYDLQLHHPFQSSVTEICGGGGVQSWRRVEEKKGDWSGHQPKHDGGGWRAMRELGSGGGGSSVDGPWWCRGLAAGRCGPVQGKWKMGPAQEAQCRFHNYSKIFHKN
jgi:hypothetical protein